MGTSGVEQSWVTVLWNAVGAAEIPDFIYKRQGQTQMKVVLAINEQTNVWKVDESL